VYWEQILGSSIEVAIAIAGFSGIIAVFGQRDAGEWRAADQLRLRILITASGVALLFSMTPFIALDAGVSAELFWRVGSGLQATWLVSIFVIRIRQAARSGAANVLRIPLLLPINLLSVIALVTNAAFYGVSWLYVIGVMFQLSIAFITFSSLLLDLWEDDAT